MDLLDLRGLLDGQRARLVRERQALAQRRQPSPRPATPQEFVPAKSQTAETTKPVDERFPSQVAGALCQRIDNLNSFKNQLVTQGEKENHEQVESSEDCDVLIDKSETGYQHSFCEFLPEPNESASFDAYSQPVEEKKDFEKSGTLLNDGPKSAKISELQSKTASLPNRDEEIERLQEKLSSVPFWDNFGRSATSKKWCSNDQETMVRVGEFSPANPDLQAPGKALLGLGEYEERRRQLLEKKKLEYKEYLSQTRNCLQKTDHLQHPSTKCNINAPNVPSGFDLGAYDLGHSNAVDAATQTDSLFIEQSHREYGSLPIAPADQNTLTIGEPLLQQLSPRVPRAHASQTAQQLPDARLRQLQLQEELRLQIEEKRRLEIERREQERIEEEALQRRVAEQQARLQAEYERDEKLRQEREIQKQQQIEEFQRRQEELRAESEALKLEERRLKLASNNVPCDQGSKNAHLVPPSEPAPLSILKSTSPPLRSPRRAARDSQYSDDFSSVGPPSPRALIRVIEGPTLPKHSIRLEDSLPIPLMPVAHSHAPAPSLQSPRRSPHVSPHRSPRPSPHHSPRHSPSRFVSDPNYPPAPARPRPRLGRPAQAREPSEAMRNLEERWKVPAVQKNVCVRGKPNVQDSNTGNVLTQLGAFRRQLQMEHMRMEEKVRERRSPHHYQQQYYQQHTTQRSQYS